MSYLDFGLKPESSLFNYCLWAYSPINVLKKSSIPSIAILYESFRLAGVLGQAHQFISKLLSLLGSTRTVFGIKASSAGFSWEFYFYDYAELNRQYSITSILNCFFPNFTNSFKELDSLPYLMFSVEFVDSPSHFQSTPKLSLYLGHPGGTLFGGKSYLVTDEQPVTLRLANIYSFYDYLEDQEQFEQHVSLSVHLLPALSSRSLADMRSSLPCNTLCLAHKPLSDALYFSGVPFLDALVYLKSQVYMSTLLPFLSSMNRSLDYLLLDIGVDYNINAHPSNPWRISIYGTF